VNVKIKRYLVIICSISCFLFMHWNNCYELHAETMKKPIAIMVGNSPEEITHQTGIGDADVIYEMNVEFPFTRLMAIFLDDEHSIVGPVRSSRFYFSRIAAEWSTIFTHCGGQTLKNEQISNLDQMRYSYPFWRDKNIGGWINLFTDTDKIREKSQQLGIPGTVNLKKNFLNFREKAKSGGEKRKITIKYHQKYTVSYEYIDNSNTYNRFVNNQSYLDSKTSKLINASNIIVQYVPVNKISGDKEGRLKVEVIGEGIAKVFSGGEYLIAKWIKESKDHNTLFYDGNGNMIKLNKGQTWIEIVSKETEVWIK